MAPTQSPIPETKATEEFSALSRSSTTDSSVNMNAETSSRLSTTTTPSKTLDNGHPIQDFSQISTNNGSSKRGSMMTIEGLSAALNSTIPWL